MQGAQVGITQKWLPRWLRRQRNCCRHEGRLTECRRRAKRRQQDQVGTWENWIYSEQVAQLSSKKNKKNKKKKKKLRMQ